MSVSLYNHTANRWETVDEPDITDRIKSGEYTFQTGIDIPVKGRDGKLYDVPSDKAYEAFQTLGGSWATGADKAAWETGKKEDILAKQYEDSTGTALAAGTLRGATFGGSDIVAPYIGEAFGGDAAGIREGLKETKERQPIASGIGQVAGTVLTAPILGTASVGTAGERLGVAGAEKAAALLGEGTIASPAARLVSTMAPTVAGNVAEGAVYGLGDGISEAALGKPEDIASNLVAGVTLGGLTGGTFGAAIGAGKVAKPFLSKATDAVAGATESAIKTVARKAAKSELTAAATEAGDKEALALITEHGLIDTEEGQAIRELYISGKTQEALNYAKEAGKQKAALDAEAASLERGTRSYLKEMPKDEADIAKRHLEEAAYDAVKARNGVIKEYSAADAVFRQETAALNGPAAYGEKLVKQLEDHINTIKESGDKLAVSKAEDVQAVIDTQLSGGHVTEGQEINALRNIKSALKRDEFKNIALHDGRKGFLDLEAAITDKLKNHPRPFVAESFTEGNKLYQSAIELGKIIGKQNPRMSAVEKLLINPETRDAALGFAGTLSDYAPELKAFVDTVKDQVGQREALKAINAKLIEGNINSPTGKISLDDMKAIIEHFGLTRGNIQQRVARIDQIKQVVDGLQGLSPMEQAVRLERAVKGGPSTLEKYLPFEKQFDALGRLSAMKEARDSVLQKGLRATAGFTAGFAASGGNPVHGLHAAGAAVLLRPGQSPAQILKTLNRVEKAAYSGTRRVSNAFKTTVEAVTGPKAVRASRLVSGVMVDREKFDNIRDHVGRLQSPDAISEVLSNIDSSAAPQVHGAIAQKIISAAKYLNDTMPKDPLAGYALKAEHTPHKASDLDVARYLRRVQAVNDPVTVIERVGQGVVTNEEIAALKTVHPEIFQSLQHQLFDGIINAKEPVPYQNRLILKQLFGIPTDYSLRPEFTAKMQANFAPADQGGRPTEGTMPSGETKTQTSRKAVDLKPRNQLTAAQNTEYKDFN